PVPSRTGALRRRLGDAAWRSAGLCPIDRFVPLPALGAATAHLLPHLDEASACGCRLEVVRALPVRPINPGCKVKSHGAPPAAPRRGIRLRMPCGGRAG